jgi:hypothetical protein
MKKARLLRQPGLWRFGFQKGRCHRRSRTLGATREGDDESTGTALRRALAVLAIIISSFRSRENELNARVY